MNAEAAVDRVVREGLPVTAMFEWRPLWPEEAGPEVIGGRALQGEGMASGYR